MGKVGNGIWEWKNVTESLMDWLNSTLNSEKKGMDTGNKDVSDLQKQKDFITRRLGITRKDRMFFRQKENGIT